MSVTMYTCHSLKTEGKKNSVAAHKVRVRGDTQTQKNEFLKKDEGLRQQSTHAGSCNRVPTRKPS